MTELPNPIAERSTSQVDGAITTPSPVPVWPVFLAFVLVFIVLAVGQVVVILIMAIMAMQRAVSEAPAEEFWTDPFAGVHLQLVMILLYLPVVIALIGVAVVMARASRQPLSEALGLRRPRVSVLGYLLLLLGTWIPFAIAAGCATLVATIAPPAAGMEAVWSPSHPLLAISYVLTIAFGAGVAEEVFFRGYMQRRLLRRWSPWLAIGVTSLLFALLHVAPTVMALAFPLGIWLGVIAWRTGSVWPAVFCHAIINGVWNALQISLYDGDSSSRGVADITAMEWMVTGAFGAVALAAFVGSIVLLVRIRPQAE